MRRREFMILSTAAVAGWPRPARAQQPLAPTIGFLSSLSVSDQTRILGPFNAGLKEAGFVEGRNVAIEYRFAEGDYGRLPALVADLIGLRVAVITAIGGTPAAVAAKAATSTIPIVFANGGDPQKWGLVANFNRPDGNVTGVTFYTAPLAAKRLELLRQLVPKATTVGVLFNPNNPPSAFEAKSVPAAAIGFGLQPITLSASSGGEIDEAFAALAQQQIGTLFVSSDPLFFNQRGRLATLAARYNVPAIYADEEIAEAGGLMSYGASRSEAYRQAGVYAGRILRGEKPGDLPVVLPTKFKMVFNLRTAKALDITVPPTLLAIADEVIE
jgi:putative tryptophan/tyrosine transport system substrate-binding protein